MLSLKIGPSLFGASLGFSNSGEGEPADRAARTLEVVLLKTTGPSALMQPEFSSPSLDLVNDGSRWATDSWLPPSSIVNSIDHRLGFGGGIGVGRCRYKSRIRLESVLIY